MQHYLGCFVWAREFLTDWCCVDWSVTDTPTKSETQNN